jgi:hypothetical protein
MVQAADGRTYLERKVMRVIGGPEPVDPMQP